MLDQLLKDMGHTGFRHNEQSLRVVDVLENDGAGLNLTWEVRDGIRNHTGDERPGTLEGEIVHLSDRIAYVNHDLDDALRARLISVSDVPGPLLATLGSTSSERIDMLVHDLVDASIESDHIRQSPRIGTAMSLLREFLFDTVYARSVEQSGGSQVEHVLRGLFFHFLSHPQLLPGYECPASGPGPEPGAESAAGPVPAAGAGDRQETAVRVADYVAGMSDRFAMNTYFDIFLPKGWAV